jgi:hypothetical protein
MFAEALTRDTVERFEPTAEGARPILGDVHVLAANFVPVQLEIEKAFSL